MKLKKLIPWIPSLVSLALGVVFTIVYAVTDGSVGNVYAQLLIGAAVPFVFPIWGAISKKPMSLSLSIMTAILVFLGIHLAKAAHMYSYWPRFDRLLHTNFGLMGSAMIYALFLRWNGDKMHPVGMVLAVFLSVLGVGALWEILEYVCSLFTGEDPQGAWGVIDAAIREGARGKNPLYDTIWDLAVTCFGSFAFIAFYVIDRIFGGKACKVLFGEPLKMQPLEQTSAAPAAEEKEAEEEAAPADETE